MGTRLRLGFSSNCDGFFQVKRVSVSFDGSEPNKGLSIGTRSRSSTQGGRSWERSSRP